MVTPSAEPALDGKTYVVTGANSGIGKETALALSRMGGHVVMVCRSKEKGEAARKDIARKSGGGGVDLILCDLSSLSEVRKLAASLAGTYGRIDVLVNNAGLFSLSGKTVDGYEKTLAVDYLAPFFLTNLLLDKLKSSAPSRVVNVASTAHFGGHVDLAAIENGGGATGWRAYSNSKLALVMFTYELARRLKGTGVTANCLHPGAVATHIWRIPPAIVRPFLRSAKKGAQTSVYLASAGEVEGVTGEYFENEAPKRSSRESYDEQEAASLWELTAKMVGLSGAA